MKIILKSGKELELAPDELQELFGASNPIFVPYNIPVPMPRHEGPWWGIVPPYGWPWTGGTSGGITYNNCTAATDGRT